jgi:hypothetical protein
MPSRDVVEKATHRTPYSGKVSAVLDTENGTFIRLPVILKTPTVRFAHFFFTKTQRNIGRSHAQTFCKEQLPMIDFRERRKSPETTSYGAQNILKLSALE